MMKVYVVTGSQDNGYLYAPFVFSTREKALAKMEEIAREEFDFQRDEMERKLKFVQYENSITLNYSEDGVAFLFEVTEVEVE